MGRPMPGYTVALVDPVTGEPADEGEICLPLANRPLGLMVGYRDDDERTSEAMRDGYYHTGDVASRDADGYITYVGRTDDVFKASDYRISPFELESRADRARGGRRGGGRAVAGPAAARGAEGLRRAGRRVRADARDRALDPAPLARAPRALQAHPPDRVLPSCRRRSAARSAASSCARARSRTKPGGWSEADFPELRALGAVPSRRAAWADALLYRCGPNVCRAAPDGTGRKALRHAGNVRLAVGLHRRDAPGVIREHVRVRARRDGRQLGDALPRGGIDVIAEMAPDGRQVADGRVAARDQPRAGRQPPGHARASRASCRTCS